MSDPKNSFITVVGATNGAALPNEPGFTQAGANHVTFNAGGTFAGLILTMSIWTGKEKPITNSGTFWVATDIVISGPISAGSGINWLVGKGNYWAAHATSATGSTDVSVPYMYLDKFGG